MSTLDSAQKRVIAVLEEIYRLKQSEFPYTHSRDALDLIGKKFIVQKAALEKVSSDTPKHLIQNLCSVSLYQLYIFIPILGFIIRSINIRNAFEAYAPLLRLAQSILGNETKLIISSEWDYSPYVYKSITGLREFVFIGLPATESANPLLIPLAGHELGHSVWESEHFSEKFEKQIEKLVLDILIKTRWDEYSLLHPTISKEDLRKSKEDLRSKDIFVLSTWISAFTWSLLQMEEIFCDFIGLRLFAESFLHAFAYLISPGISGRRNVGYPNLTRRVSHLIYAAKQMKVNIPQEFESSFVDDNEPVEPTTNLLVSIADDVSASFIEELIQIIVEFTEKKNINECSKNNVMLICEDFSKRIVPIREYMPIVDILNAGWKCNLDSNLWNDVPHIKSEERSRILWDLMLKSMEVSEVKKRLEFHNDS